MRVAGQGIPAAAVAEAVGGWLWSAGPGVNLRVPSAVGVSIEQRVGEGRDDGEGVVEGAAGGQQGASCRVLPILTPSSVVKLWSRSSSRGPKPKAQVCDLGLCP